MVLEQVAEMIHKAQKGVAFTGAGISVESGIPDFRSPTGIWSKYPLEKYGTKEAFERDPEEFWRFFSELAREVAKAKPNPAHYALAALEKQGKLLGVVTQNIDGLHRQAGTKRLAELHGRPDWVKCLQCGREEPCSPSEITTPPRCPCCKVILKPDVVLFGDLLPMEAWQQASQWMRECDLLLIIGTSGVVEPAASLPWIAKEHGAKICQFDLAPNALTVLADLFVPGPAGENFQKLAQILQLTF